MLVEPEADAERLALDRAVAEAVRLRVAAGPRPTPDADAIALRELLAGAPAGSAAADPEQALAAVRDGARALMDLTPGKAWWGRLLAEPALRVVAALPDDRTGAPRALMIQRANPGPTGGDRTFWATDSQMPDARIVETLAVAGLAADPLIAAGGLKLFMLAGYVQADDARLNGAPGELSGVIGAAPLF